MNGAQGQMTNVCHNRLIVVMCVFSESGLNTAIIFHVNGICLRLFDGDVSLRDNGAICKFISIMFIDFKM